MSVILPEGNPEVRARTVARCRERGILLPTLAQMRDPSRIPAPIRESLAGVGLWDVNPRNLFRITWKNDPVTGGFGPVNVLELPPALTGVPCRIAGLVGKWFPTGAHKVGAAYGCLAPRLVTGAFDPTRDRAVWPSTGNYCRGGAFDCALLACTAVAILPEGMSRERFEWLRSIGAEVIATPGTESNVKEIYDKCWELRKDPANVILNQFDEFGNPLFHYQVTGPALLEAFEALAGEGLRLAGFVSATGSAGTIAAGDFLKARRPGTFVVASEALQCPTLFLNGFGAHRIEGIGDKHVPWVHNVRNTDGVAAIDDEDCMRLLRLFNEESGQAFLCREGVPEEVVSRLPLLGISGIGNLLAAVKAAKWWDLGPRDVVLTVFTDSAEMYGSRVAELREDRGTYGEVRAARDFEGSLLRQRTDWFRELDFRGRRALHNLKYYTWVEQQGKTSEALEELWDPAFWQRTFEEEVPALEAAIEAFNRDVLAS
ncbi:pyridoxal-phosphate dependent enzyme [Myxococcota bacterium]|nr:pyridoxal-phosphate dependent enzyme [Myxococcota bacterium]